ncbi:MAG: DUF1572 family protein [Acidobacteriaceae bacterium]
MHQFSTSYIADSVGLFGYYKKLAEGAMAQASDEEFFRALDPESNSIAIVVKHLIGNMRSRWTGFLTSDGEKPWRTRDQEFEELGDLSRTQLLEQWESAWGLVFAALEPLSDADLSHLITIRGEPHSVMQAINRQIAHYSYHVGQIVFLAKHFRSAAWKTLSVARNRSAEFNARVTRGEASQR